MILLHINRIIHRWKHQTRQTLHIMAMGGIAVKEGLITGNLIQGYRLGNTKVKIYDSAYAGKTEQDINSILNRIAEIGNSEADLESEKEQ